MPSSISAFMVRTSAWASQVVSVPISKSSASKSARVRAIMGNSFIASFFTVIKACFTLRVGLVRQVLHLQQKYFYENIHRFLLRCKLYRNHCGSLSIFYSRVGAGVCFYDPAHFCFRIIKCFFTGSDSPASDSYCIAGAGQLVHSDGNRDRNGLCLRLYPGST